MKTKSLIIVGILIIAFAAMVAPVMAVSTGSATVAGNTVDTIDITVTGDLTGFSLTPPTATSTDALTLAVSANTDGWHVDVKDPMTGKVAGSAGKMQEAVSIAGAYEAAGEVMDAALQLSAPTSGAGTSAGTITLGADDAHLLSGSAATSSYSQLLTLTQTVSYTTDPVLTTENHVYKIVVAFTGTTT